MDACDERGGWHYDDADAPTEVVACPATCDALQDHEEAKLDVLFGCEVELL